MHRGGSGATQIAVTAPGRLFLKSRLQGRFLWSADESNARRLINKHSPSVLVCDLGYENDWVGLIMIKNLREDYPELFVIGVSRGEFNPRDVVKSRPSFHMFIDKSDLNIESSLIDKYIAEFRAGFQVGTSGGN